MHRARYRLAVVAAVIVTPGALWADDFTVAKGQLTFDAEGLEKPGSPFHSRVPHWPGGASGVTIGRGYDMKFRAEAQVTADLTAAGVPDATAKKLAKGAKKSGKDAETFVKENKALEISTAQQKTLFESVYAHYEGEVKRIVAKADVVAAYGKTDWGKLHPAIKDLLVDLLYRGDYTSDSRKKIQKLVAANDLKGLTAVVADKAQWPGVPGDRFNRRARFMKAAAGVP